MIFISAFSLSNYQRPRQPIYVIPSVQKSLGSLRYSLPSLISTPSKILRLEKSVGNRNNEGLREDQERARDEASAMVDNREKEICRIKKGHRKGINGNLGTKKEEENMVEESERWRETGSSICRVTH